MYVFIKTYMFYFLAARNTKNLQYFSMSILCFTDKHFIKQRKNILNYTCHANKI